MTKPILQWSDALCLEMPLMDITHQEFVALLVRQMAHELGLWFPQHAQSMDASLALHLRSAGYDPVTGAIAPPQALAGGMIRGCGSSTCGDAGVKSPSAREVESLV